MKVFWHFIDTKILNQLESKGEGEMSEFERNRYQRKKLVSRVCGPSTQIP